MIKHLLLVASGGAIGASFRYLAGMAALRIMGPGFPYGTLFVNVAGSFLMGILAEFIIRKFGATSELRLFLLTGLLGGFTTFSAFSLDAVALFEKGAHTQAGIYIIVSVVASIIALFIGLLLARNIF